MWKRLAAVWLVGGICLYFLFFYRIETHAVKLDMPLKGPTDPRQVQMEAWGFTVAVFAIVLFALLGLCIWFSIRILRRYRKAP